MAPSQQQQEPDVHTTLASISDLLQNFQQNMVLLERLGTALAQDPDPDEYSLSQVAAQQDVVDELAASIRKAFAEMPRKIEDLPRKEQARPKAALSKLRKDFDRVAVDLRKTIEKIKASRRAALKRNGKVTTARSGNTKPHITSGKGDLQKPHRVGQAQFGPSDAPGDLDVMIGDERIQLQVAMEEEAINDAILREREEEITEINQNVHKVNEIFKDLANLVDKQQTEVDQIGDLVEKSHAHAEKGLDQVQKAAKLQPSCAIS